MTVDSTPPDSADLEFDLGEIASLPTPLAVETPLPRCLSQGSSLTKTQRAVVANIPPAPRLPQFEGQAAVPLTQPAEDVREAETLRARARPPADPNTPLQDPDPAVAHDRVLPGSPALVSTFRPKPIVPVCYSVTQSAATERVYRSRRPLPRVGNKK
jgi:hypothetical protein